MSDYSGVFEPHGAGQTQNAGAACFFNGALYYFNTGKAANGRVWALRCSQPAGDAQADVAWTSAELPEDQVRTKVASSEPTAPVVIGDALYLFWFGGGHASVTRLGGNGQWAPYSVVQDKAGSLLGDGGAYLSAVALGDALILLTEVNRKTLALTWHLFDLAGHRPGSPWRAIREVSVPAAKLAERAGVHEFNAIAHAGSAWYSQGGGTTTARLSENVLIQSFVAQTTDDHGVVFASHPIVVAIPLGTDLMPVVGTEFRAWTLAEATSGVVLRRDPGGRIRAVWRRTSDQQIGTTLLATDRPIAKLSWSKHSVMFDDSSVTTRFAPAADFVLGPPLAEGTEYETRMFVFSQRDRVRDDIQCQYAYYGRLKRVVDAEVVDLTTGSKAGSDGSGIHLLRGYIDGPVPMPNVNVAVDPHQVAGSIVYGHTATAGSSHEVAQDMTVGVKTTGSPTLGAGPAWDVSVSGGSGSTYGTAATVSLSHSHIQNNKVSDGRMLGQGTAFVNDIVLHRDEFRFYPSHLGGRDENAPLFASIYTSYSNASLRSFPVRTTSPGDLHSYTREAWNRRMAELFPHEPSYRHDYIENQIVAQALALEHGGGVTKALEYGWAMSGEITASAAWTISSFSENRWTFQSSVYAGFAFNFWGVGQASFMVGTTFDTQTKVRTITDDSWGVNATFDLPAPSRDPDAIQEYDFTMYFLPANRQWTVEFRHLNPDLAGQIDEFSESWKIVCVVTRIVRNGELAELAAHGLGDGAIAVLRGSGITTIAQLLQRHRARAREDAIARRLAREDLDPPAHAALAAAKAWVAANEWRDRG